MYQPRTDLALEAHEIAKKNLGKTIDGVAYSVEKIKGFSLTRVEIETENAAKITQKPCGKYLTLHIGSPWNDATDSMIKASYALSELIDELIRDKISSSSPVLIAGLGNITVTADAIGPKSLEHIIVTRHIKTASPTLFAQLGLFDIAALSPGVLSQTGVETAEIIKSLVDKISPCALIAIDSLASKNLDRLASTIQLSDTGISPGSGMGNRRSTLNEESVGVPVISIGVPTVVDANALAFDIVDGYCQKNPQVKDLASEIFKDISPEKSNCFVTPKDTDLIISCLSKIIGYGINLAFHKKLKYDEMVSIAN